jgi:hypothetical protein
MEQDKQETVWCCQDNGTIEKKEDVYCQWDCIRDNNTKCKFNSKNHKSLFYKGLFLCFANAAATSSTATRAPTANQIPPLLLLPSVGMVVVIVADDTSASMVGSLIFAKRHILFYDFRQ